MQTCVPARQEDQCKYRASLLQAISRLASRSHPYRSCSPNTLRLSATPTLCTSSKHLNVPGNVVAGIFHHPFSCLRFRLICVLHSSSRRLRLENDVYAFLRCKSANKGYLNTASATKLWQRLSKATKAQLSAKTFVSSICKPTSSCNTAIRPRPHCDCCHKYLSCSCFLQAASQLSASWWLTRPVPTSRTFPSCRLSRSYWTAKLGSVLENVRIAGFFVQASKHEALNPHSNWP